MVKVNIDSRSQTAHWENKILTSPCGTKPKFPQSKSSVCFHGCLFSWPRLSLERKADFVSERTKEAPAIHPRGREACSLIGCFCGKGFELIPGDAEVTTSHIIKVRSLARPLAALYWSLVINTGGALWMAGQRFLPALSFRRTSAPNVVYTYHSRYKPTQKQNASQTFF